MGVSNLQQSDLVTAVRRTISLEVLRGKKIAGDANAFLYRFKYAVQDGETHIVVARMKELFDTFQQFRIKIVWLFEGKSPPIKERERLRRAAIRENLINEKRKAEEKVDNVKRQKMEMESGIEDLEMLLYWKQSNQLPEGIPSVRATVPIHVNEDGTVRVDIIVSATQMSDFYDSSLSSLDTTSLSAMISSFQEQHSQTAMQEKRDIANLEEKSLSVVKITKADISLFKAQLDLRGWPWIQCDEESDFVAGALADEITGFLSPDGDTLWHRCNLITYGGLKEINQQHTVHFVSIAQLLKTADLTMSQFRAICW